MASTSSSKGKYKFSFESPHEPPTHTPGPWHVERDNADEVEVLDQSGMFVALIGGDNDPNAQCISLVPELVAAVYVAMRALKGTMPDDQSPETISAALSDLLKRCYASSGSDATIRP